MFKRFMNLLFLFAILLIILCGCEIDGDSATVTFIVDGEIVEVFSAKNGSRFAFPIQPVKNDCIFKGWYCDGVRYDSNSIVSGDIVLEALWEEQSSEQSDDNSGQNDFNNPTQENDTHDSEKENHTHGSSDWIIIKTASCISEGKRIKKCIYCDMILAEEVFARTEHNYKNETTEPACNKPGFIIKSCKDCGYSEEPLIFGEPLYHNYGEWDIEVTPGCETEGLKVRECERCGDVDKKSIIANGHSMGEPAFVSEGQHIFQCTFCEYNETVDCTYVQTIKESTCAEEGIVTNTCSECKNSYTEKGDDPLGHIYENGVCKNCDAPLFKFVLDMSKDFYRIEGFLDKKETIAVIPSEYEGLPVKVIGQAAFADNKSVTEVYIGENIECIEPFSLSSCNSLARVNFKNGEIWEVYAIDDSFIEEFSFISSSDAANRLKGVYAQCFIKKKR